MSDITRIKIGDEVERSYQDFPANTEFKKRANTENGIATSVVIEDEPTAITIADNTEYYLTNVLTLTFTYPESGNYECCIILTTASTGEVSITFPTSTYIVSAPTFSNNETWEISIKNGCIVACKVVSD